MAADDPTPISRLYHEALGLSPSERAAYLARACGADARLREEVESLLAQDASALLADGVAAMAAPMLPGEASTMTGRTIGSYVIGAALGAGGMGEVYRARDTKLGRDVAVKILPRAFTSDPERLGRFEREARMLASLNHPHIAAIYGIETYDGVPALVLELVEGGTLGDRLRRGPLPVPEALRIARQIADALAAAHEKGIVHRDLKPSNVALTPDRAVKVLDFGLAKACVSESEANLTQSPTITVGETRDGVLLGTAAYMAPEQARGKAVDKRADIWAFGAVLFEMLTRRRPFDGEDVAEVLGAVVRLEPPWDALSSDVPPPIRTLLQGCLVKDPRHRVADISIALFVLDHSASLASPAVTTTPARASLARVRSTATAAVVTVAVLVTGLTIWRARRTAEMSRAVGRFAINLPNQMQLSALGQDPVAISPDGTHLVYVANQRLYLRALNQLAAAPMAGTEGGGTGGFARAPFFSPDGQWIAFWQEGRLRKVALSGGAGVTICATGLPFGASWGPDDQILWGATRGIMRAPASGGTPELLISVKEGEQASDPQVLPRSEWVLFMLHRVPAPGEQILPLVERGQVVIQSPTTGERRVLIEGVRDVRYVASGHLLYAQGNTLLAQAFDLDRLAVSGRPVPVLDGVANSGAASYMHVAISTSGTLLYVPGISTALTRLVQVARDGSRSTLAELAGMTLSPRFSPDGLRVAYALSAHDAQTDPADLWVLDVARGARTRVTFTGDNRYFPIWTRDGTRLTFADGGGTTNRVLSMLADGSGGLKVLMDVGARRFPTSWSPDGRTLAFYAGGNAATKSRQIWLLRRNGDHWTQASFVESPFEQAGAIFSPDGHWVVYVSNKSGQNDIYARPYPGPGGEVTISVGGGGEPVWAPSGRELFYRHDGKLLAVSIGETASSLTVGAPARLFDAAYMLDRSATQGGVANYDIAPDGRRFVMVEEARPRNADATDSVQLQIIVNWFEDLKQRVPTK
jgi:Tol biopolymer transport system component